MSGAVRLGPEHDTRPDDLLGSPARVADHHRLLAPPGRRRGQPQRFDREVGDRQQGQVVGRVEVDDAGPGPHALVGHHLVAARPGDHVGVGDDQVVADREAAAEQDPAAAPALDLEGGVGRLQHLRVLGRLGWGTRHHRPAQGGERLREPRAVKQPPQLGQGGRRPGGVVVDRPEHARGVDRPGERRQGHVAQGQGDEPHGHGGDHGRHHRPPDGVGPARPAPAEQRTGPDAEQVADGMAGGRDQEEHHHRGQQPPGRAVGRHQQAGLGGRPRPKGQPEQEPEVAKEHHREPPAPATERGQGQDHEQEDVDRLQVEWHRCSGRAGAGKVTVSS